MFGKFLKNFAIVKGQDAGAGVMGALAGWDPEGAGEADIRTMADNLDTLVKQAVIAQQEFKKEYDEYVEIQGLYDRRLGGIENLENRKLETTDAAAVAQLDAVILEEMDKLEAMLPDIEREKEEADVAKADKEEIDAICKLAAEKLKGARAELKNAMKGMERSKRKAQRAEDKAKNSAQVAGIAKDMSKMSSALGAMQAKTAENEAAAEAATMKSSLLKTTDVATSSIMEEAMNAAEGKPAAQKLSVQERLAALKAKK